MHVNVNNFRVIWWFEFGVLNLQPIAIIYFIFSPYHSTSGVNHLIDFNKNRIIISRNHSIFACRFFHLSSPLPRSHVLFLQRNLIQNNSQPTALLLGFEKRGRFGIWTANANPQDHSALAESEDTYNNMTHIWWAGSFFSCSIFCPHSLGAQGGNDSKSGAIKCYKRRNFPHPQMHVVTFHCENSL